MSDASIQSQCEGKTSQASFRDMMRYASRTDWLLLLLGLLLSAANGAVFIGMLIYFGQLTDIIIMGQSQYDNKGLDKEKFKSEMLQCSTTHFIGAAFILAFGLLGFTLVQLISERQIQRIKERFLYHVLNQDISWLDKNEIGKLTQKMTTGIDRIQNGTGKTIALIVQAVAGLCAGLIISFVVSWQVSLVMLVFLPPLVVSIYGSGQIVKIMLRRETKAYELANTVAEEVLTGIRTVASFNAQEFEVDRYIDHLNKGYRSGVRKVFWTAFFAAIYNLIVFGSMAVLFWYGSNLALDGYCSPGMVQAIFWLFAISSIRIGQIAPSISNVVSAKIAAKELLAIIDRVPETDCESDQGFKPDDIKGHISFDNLHFRYPTRPEVKVLNGVSFDVSRGQKVALVGHSGCGKSTLVSLLMRFYDPEQGRITLDGRPITELNLKWLRNVIGIVSQEPVIFAGTVEYNLKMGNECSTREDMKNACRMANAEEFIIKLPKGYETLIGDGNIRLSGGQKQRLAIARALIRKPRILLLDEATSALDNDSEKIIQAAIDKATSGRTCIIIAHRLSTIRNADKILVFDQGQIVEAGNHNELMRNDDSVYKQLIQAQEIEQAHQVEDAVLSDTDSISFHQAHMKQDSLSRPKPTRRTLELLSTHSARSSLQSVHKVSDETGVSSDDNNMDADAKTIVPTSILKILRLAQPEILHVIGGVVLAFARGLSWPIYTLLLGNLFYSMSSLNSDHDQLKHENMVTGLLFGGLSVYSAVLTLVSGSMLGLTGERLTNRLRIQVFKNFLRQDSSFYDRPENAVGKLMIRLASDAPNVQAALDQRLADILQSLTSFFIGVIAGVYLDWKMAVAEMASVSIILGAQLIILQSIKRRTLTDAQLEEDAAKIVNEAIQNVKTVQSMNRQKHIYERFVDATMHPYKRSIQRGVLESATISLSTCTEVLNFGLVYMAGAFLISNGYVAPVVAFQVVSVVNSGVIMSFLPAASFVPEFLRARVSASLMLRMIEKPSKIDSMSDQGLKPEFHGDIEFKHAYFSYPNQKLFILKDLNLKAYRGQTLALVGISGCGKSTTIQLLERYYDLLSGSLLIDNVDIRKINIRHLRANMALVSQEPNFFNLTIRDNITYGLKSVTDAQVFEAAKFASIHDFIETLPQKYETIVGPRGGRLSGGQRQRLAIARAIIRNPKILLLDEATAALDTKSEKLVQLALENASHGRTCICIAHRLSTIQHADVIAVVKDGHVIEQGSHQNLLNQKGLYYRLVQKHN